MTAARNKVFMGLLLENTSYLVWDFWWMDEEEGTKY